MKHIVLIGDSIFDNASYVDTGDCVIEQLTKKIPMDSKATLLAVDGDITQDVYAQLEKMPADTSHVFLSIGGNDALRIIDILNENISTVGEAMEVFAEIREDFRAKYHQLLVIIKEKYKNLVVCTIHDSIPDFENRALTALAFYNEIILKQAFALNISVIDLRLLCNNKEDYSTVSPIEPSRHGARKIAEKINLVTQSHGFSSSIPVIYK
jgi:lysophospholipase L1-like esterase